jgi:hypothetical protein
MKAPWINLSKAERAELMALKTATNSGNGYNLPEGYSDCGLCGTPTSGRLCNQCDARMDALEQKGLRP